MIFDRRRMNYAAVLLIGVMALPGGVLTAPRAREQKRSNEAGAWPRYAPRDAPSQTPRAPSTRSVPRCSGERGATSSTGLASSEICRTLSAAGIDYVRVLGSVGGASWEDRETDPRWPDYDHIIAGMTDLAYDRYGMRVQWTLFGGAPFTASERRGPRWWIASPRCARGREHKIFAFEIANEAWQNGFPGARGSLGAAKPGRAPERQDGRAGGPQLAATGRRMCDVRRRGRRCDDAALRPRIRQPGPNRATAAALELSGRVRPCMSRRIASCRLQQRADWARELGQAGRFAVENCRGVRVDLPRRQRQLRSARRSRNPRRRRGGQSPRSSRRHAHFDELPSFNPIATALAAAKQYLPPGLANWTRHAPDAATAPMHGFNRLYSASNGSGFVALAVGITQPIVLHARRGASIDVRETSTGRLVKRLNVSSGESVTLSGGESLALIGHFTASGNSVRKLRRGT